MKNTVNNPTTTPAMNDTMRATLESITGVLAKEYYDIAVQDPYGIKTKMERLSKHVMITNDQEVITTFYNKSVIDLDQKFAIWFEGPVGETLDKAIVHAKPFAVAQTVLHNAFETEAGRAVFTQYAMQIASALTFKGKIAAADAVETAVRVLKDYYNTFEGTDDRKYATLQILARQMITICENILWVKFDEKVKNKTGKQVSKIFYKVLMPVTEKALIKRLNPKNMPVNPTQVKESQIKDIYKGKTFYHKNIQHSVAVLEYMDKVASFTFTIGEIGTTKEELTTWLKAKTDWTKAIAIEDSNYNSDVYLARSILRIQSFVGKDVCLPVSFDGRGRSKYLSTALGLNPHGDSYETAMWELTNKQVITEDGGLELALLIATEMAGRKNPRINLQEFVNNWDTGAMWKDNCPTTTGRGLPDLYNRKLWKAYSDYKTGTPSGFIARVDGTNSGLQFISTALRDTMSAKLCNVGGHKEIYDAYGVVATGLNKEFDITALGRGDVKDAFTVTMYGAGSDTAVNAHRNEDSTPLAKRMEEFIPGDNEWNRKSTLTQIAFGKVFDSNFSIVNSAIATILSAYRESITDTKLSHTWTTGDGFVAQSYNYEEGHSKNVTYVDAKGKVQKTIVVSNFPNKKARQRSLFANLTHSLDGYALREVQRRLGVEMLTKHDDFGVHANNLSTLKKTYAEVVMDIAKENHLELMFNEAVVETRDSADEKYITLRKGNMDLNKIKTSINALR